jgi:hypothetical protein
MAKILIIHGIANQYRGENELRQAWYPALCDGLALADCKDVPSIDDCFCPFYGALFRPIEHLSLKDAVDETDVEDASPSEVALLTEVWKAAALTDPAVPPSISSESSLARFPRVAEKLLNALARSSYLVDYLPLRLFGDLKQVDLYMNDRELHERILGQVSAQIGSDTVLVIGHSLGSVIAYEAVCRKPENVRALITIGSPLGIRNVVFDKLTPTPHLLGSDLGRWPGRIREWTNIAARGDIVAAQKQLAPLFGNKVNDVMIDSGWDTHSSTRYLNSVEAGLAVARALNSDS